MNRFIAGTVVLLLCCLGVLKVTAVTPEVEKARQHGAEGQVTLRVADSTGKPVEKAQMSVAFFPSDSAANADVREALTDSNGCIRLEGKTVADMNYTITKDGYYKTTGKYWFYRQGENCLRDNRWQPWNPTNTVILREHRNPVPMCAKKIDVHIPVQDQAIGFDLQKGDWVAPHGQGTTPDLLLKYVAMYEGPQVFSKRMEVAFSNPRDGVQSAGLDQTSEFMSVYSAPEEGYAPTFVEERARTRTKILKSQELGKDQYLIFRVRTVTDKEGKIVSANYGKIYGPIEYGRMGQADRLMFSYYLNPTANDRNLEFDPSRNPLGATDKRRVYQP